MQPHNLQSTRLGETTSKNKEARQCTIEVPNANPDNKGGKSVIMSSILNQVATKKFILAKFQSMRPGMPITRVSKEALEKLEARFRAVIVEEVERHPSIGKTFKL